MTLFHAVILGIVEGLTEFLPVSSTGHLILASRFLRIPPSDFLSSFEISIQIGAILAVVVLYGKRYAFNFKVTRRLIAAFLPTALVGFFLYKLIKHVFFNSVPLVIGSLLVGGIVLILFERNYEAKNANTADIENISYAHCFLIGLCQALAVIPGVSRSAATIIGGLALGISRKAIVEFSFLLAVPTLLAATAFDLMNNRHPFSAGQWDLLAAGLVTSFAVAMIGIKFFLYLIKDRGFVLFGAYRIALAVLLWFIV
jgi:undecaprenyl-diphosphatase